MLFEWNPSASCGDHGYIFDLTANSSSTGNCGLVGNKTALKGVAYTEVGSTRYINIILVSADGTQGVVARYDENLLR